jgi:hypothetical protein
LRIHNRVLKQGERRRGGRHNQRCRATRDGLSCEGEADNSSCQSRPPAHWQLATTLLSACHVRGRLTKIFASPVPQHMYGQASATGERKVLGLSCQGEADNSSCQSRPPAHWQLATTLLSACHVRGRLTKRFASPIPQHMYRQALATGEHKVLGLSCEGEADNSSCQSRPPAQWQLATTLLSACHVRWRLTKVVASPVPQHMYGQALATGEHKVLGLSCEGEADNSSCQSRPPAHWQLATTLLSAYHVRGRLTKIFASPVPQYGQAHVTRLVM